MHLGMRVRCPLVGGVLGLVVVVGGGGGGGGVGGMVVVMVRRLREWGVLLVATVGKAKRGSVATQGQMWRQMGTFPRTSPPLHIA